MYGIFTYKNTFLKHLWLEAMARASEELIRLVSVPDGMGCWWKQLLLVPKNKAVGFKRKIGIYLMLKVSNQIFQGGI